jgi:NADPH-dependent 2,4-dienoyl-CoA reductase/sulfur reductase-like enzyme
MVTPEQKLPYDRPNLSKDYLQGEAPDEWIPLRSQDFFKRYGIEIQTGRSLKGVDASSRTVTFDSGDKLPYDKLLLAMGGRPRTPDIPGIDLDNVFVLRSFADSDEIIAASGGDKKAVIVGGGFIGMEAAFSLRQRGVDVTAVIKEDIPLRHVFGPEIAKLFKLRLEKSGVEFKLERTVKKIEGEREVNKVVLDNNDVLDADFVVVGVGVDPASDRIQGVNFGDDGSVIVDQYLMSEEDIYAAGDIACFPDWRTHGQSRIEHWRTAEQQGRIAACNMLDKGDPYRSIPFFWTTQAGLHFRYVGHAPEWDEIITLGRIEDANFISYFVKDDMILAAAGIGRDKQMIAIEELMRLNRMPAPNEIKNEHPDMVALLHETDAVAH